MYNLFFVLVTILYLSVVFLLFIFGVNFFYMTYLAVRRPAPSRPAPTNAPLPPVTVQLPFYNELYVAERLVKAAASLDYPPGLLEIQVLDDSTDETGQILQKLVASLQSQGVDIC